MFQKFYFVWFGEKTRDGQDWNNGGFSDDSELN